MATANQPSQHGQYYFCVKVPKHVSTDGKIYVYADAAQVSSGSLILLQKQKDGQQTPNLILTPGKWDSVFAASTDDGLPLAVERWKGEVAP